ncbi:MAG TPA: Cof-type HAD-IIB family hydrolase [Pseudothermotoga sp.]|nr:Cof-type HAD-IIB family hydrolase [Pseudothermotoga sp.]HBT26936.1 Cof-type HAD-IIB family hydrolase [Pseudothermotoga sp.]
MKMVKLVCIDLDGTLLNQEKKVSSQDKTAIELARKKGIKITVMTGRSYYSALPYVKEIGLNIPVVFQNGALIATPSLSDIFRCLLLPSKVALYAVELSFKYGLYPIVYESFFSHKDMFVKGEYCGAFNSYLIFNSQRLNKVDNLFQILKSRDEIAEIAVIGKEDTAELFLEQLCEQTDEFTSIKNQHIDGEVFLEIFSKGVGKEIALDFLLELFHLNADEVMYIGDNYNDLGVMQKVGLPVAMSNAPDEVKKYARFITASNDESGVSLAIKKFLMEV